MSHFDGLIEKATRRLGRDRELRLEISRELESHLEASVQEYRAADYSEQEAIDAAQRAFGDPEDVADALWDANRFRLRLRAWAWWVARLTLLPACALALVLFVISGIASSYSVSLDHTGATQNQAVGPGAWAEARMKAKMTDKQRFIFYGDETATNEIDRVRTVRDVFPEELRYQMDLIAAMLSALPDDPERHPEVYAQQRDALVVELELGAAMDPDNGMYALIRAALVVRGVDILSEEAEERAEVVEVLPRKPDADEKRIESWVYRWPERIDSSVLVEAMGWIEVAASKPYLTMYTVDRVRRRLDQLPPPRSLMEFVRRARIETSTLLPTVGVSRQVARVVAAEALRRADEGNVDEAVAALDQLDAIAAKLSASSDAALSLMEAVSIDQMQRNTAVAVWRVLGDETKANDALAASDALARKWRSEWWGDTSDASDTIKRHESGVLMSQLMGAIPGYDLDPSVFRKAEYTMADRGMLVFGMATMVMLSMFATLCGGLSVWRRRCNGEQAMLLWVGWKRLLWVLGGAIGLPILVFVAWSWLPWSGRAHGLNYSQSVLISYGPLILAVLVLLWTLGEKAMRGRAFELGLAIPAPRSRGVAAVWMVGLGVVLIFVLWSWLGALGARSSPDAAGTWALGGAGVFLSGMALWVAREIVRVRGMARPSFAWMTAVVVGFGVAGGLGVLLVCLVVAYLEVIDRGPIILFVLCVSCVVGLMAGVFSLAGRPGGTAWFARSVLRSMGPLFAVAGLVLAITVGVGLNLRERALAAAMMEMSPTWLEAEIEHSNAKVLRAYLAGEESRPPRLE